MVCPKLVWWLTGYRVSLRPGVPAPRPSPSLKVQAQAVPEVCRRVQAQLFGPGGGGTHWLLGTYGTWCYAISLNPSWIPFRGPCSRLWGNSPRIHLQPPPSQYIRDSPVDSMAPSEEHGLPPHNPSPFPSDRTTKNAGITGGRSGNRFCSPFHRLVIKKLRQKIMVRKGAIEVPSVIKDNSSSGACASTDRYEQHTPTTMTMTCNDVDSLNARHRFAATRCVA